VFYQYPLASDNNLLNEKLVMDKFKEFGKIVSLQIPKHPSNGLPKGFAYVQFLTANAK
jgi:RNA recognition motif-containing protein